MGKQLADELKCIADEDHTEDDNYNTNVSTIRTSTTRNNNQKKYRLVMNS